MDRKIKAMALVLTLVAASTVAKGSEMIRPQPKTMVLTLSEAQRLVVQQNPSSKNLDEMAFQADQQIRLAWSMLLPHVGARGSVTRNQREIILQFPDFSAFDPTDPTAVLPTNQAVLQEKWSQGFGLTANMTLFDPRSIPLIQNAADGAELARISAKRHKNDLIYAVTAAYFQAYSMREMIEVARENLALAEKLVNVSAQRIEAGQSTRIDVLRAELQMGNARKELENARDALQIAKSALASLIGCESDFEIVAPEEARRIEGDLDALTDKALEGRVELREAALAENIAERNKTEAWMRWLPAFDVTYDWGWSSTGGFSGSNDQWMLVFGARWNLFEGGGRFAQLAVKDSQTRVAENNLEQIRLDIRAEVEKLFLEVGKRRRNLELNQHQIVLAEEQQKLVDDQYRVGLSTSLDALEATTELHQQRVASVLEKLQHDVALLTLDKAIGEYSSLASLSSVN